MSLRLTTLFAAALATSACAPELKPGADRADAAARADVAAVDAPRDVSAPTDAPRDAPADAPRPSARQTSCPNPAETGCGVVEIPGGTFTMGVADSLRALDASPEQPLITVDPIGLDSHEVTVARFRRFWAVASALPPVTRVAYPGGALSVTDRMREPDATSANVICNWSPTAGDRERHPINCIDWVTAQSFCVWDGGRLPTDAEWEFAARGREVGGLVAGRLYPWGDQDPLPTCDRARWNLSACAGANGGQTVPVDSYSPAPEVDGARLWNLSGNVFEWTADSFVPYSGSKRQGCWGAVPTGRRNPLCSLGPQAARSMRGGSWFYTSLAVLRSPARYGANTGDGIQLIGVGLRCARTR